MLHNEMKKELAFVLICIIFLLLFFLSYAQAHQAPSGWEYPGSCCSSVDCEPIPMDGLVQEDDGWHVIYTSARFGSINVTINYGQEKDSGDGSFHICPVRDGFKVAVRGCVNDQKAKCCFFVPKNVMNDSHRFTYSLMPNAQARR